MTAAGNKQYSEPCRLACPAGIDVAGYVRLVAQGQIDQAFAVIADRIPFPSVCGRVCFAPCEAQCRLNQMGLPPVAIRALKRFAADRASSAGIAPPPVARSSGRRVAVVGSGPAGLTAAHFLARLGHAVTVFEALPQAGGMMRVGIPDYRLPRRVLDAEIGRIISGGVEIRTSTRVNSAAGLLREGHQAVFLATGAHLAMKMGIEGEDGPRVRDCLAFLREVNLGRKVAVGKRVVVVGGGNGAVDAARTAARLGAEDVTIVYRRSRNEMPAHAAEVDEMQQEGIALRLLTAPLRIVGCGEHLSVECIEMMLGEADASGRRRPEPVPGSGFTLEADLVISAVGQMPGPPARLGLAAGDQNRVRVDPETLASSQPGVFAGGDCMTGPASVIEAIAAGRKAAAAIDRYLGGQGLVPESPPSQASVPAFCLPTTLVEGGVSIPRTPAAGRRSGFAEVELELGDREAAKEAMRCLWCDLEAAIDAHKCRECSNCQLACSLAFEGVFNPLAARLSIGGGKEPSFKEECVHCNLCARYCPYEAITLAGRG